MTPELAKDLRAAGLWERVLIDNANTGTEWRKECDRVRTQAHAEGYAAGLKKAMTLVESYSDLVPTGAMTAAISEEIQKCLTR